MSQHFRPIPACLPALLMLLSTGCAGLVSPGEARQRASVNTPAIPDIPDIPLPPRPKSALIAGTRLALNTSMNGSIPFASGSVSVPSAAAQTIDQITACLASNESASAILAGFASDRSGRGPARTLSAARALAVRHAIIAAGIHPSRIHTTGLGSDLRPPSEMTDQVWWGILR